MSWHSIGEQNCLINLENEFWTSSSSFSKIRYKALFYLFLAFSPLPPMLFTHIYSFSCRGKNPIKAKDSTSKISYFRIQRFALLKFRMHIKYLHSITHCNEDQLWTGSNIYRDSQWPSGLEPDPPLIFYTISHVKTTNRWPVQFAMLKISSLHFLLITTFYTIVYV